MYLWVISTFWLLWLSVQYLSESLSIHLAGPGPQLQHRVFSCTRRLVVTACGTYFLLIVIVQVLSHVQLFATPWTAARQDPLSSSISRRLLKFMSIELVMLSNHLILCRPPSPLSFNLSQHQGLFQWVSSSHQVAKVLELQLAHQSFQWIFRDDFL